MFGSGIRFAHLVFGIIAVVGMLVGGIGLVLSAMRNDHDAPVFELVTFGLGMFSFYATGLLGILWIYQAWNWLPNDQRYAKYWTGWITPGAAAGFMFLPYFHYYWMFVIPPGLCDALDRLQVSHGKQEPAPRQLAIVAAICQFLLLPGPLLWFLYMTRTERIMRALAGETK